MNGKVNGKEEKASRENSGKFAIRYELSVAGKEEEASREESGEFLLRIELRSNRKAGGELQKRF